VGDRRDAVDLQDRVLSSPLQRPGGGRRDHRGEVKSHVENGKNLAYLLNMIGAGVGMWLFTKVAAATGRRTAFAIGFTAALVVTAYAYWKMETPTDAYWMMPLMGAAQLGPFAGFAIYLPSCSPAACGAPGRASATTSAGSPPPAELLLRLPDEAVRHRRPDVVAPAAVLGHHDVRDLPRRPGHAAVRPETRGKPLPE
jgi:hypothetical protein